MDTLLIIILVLVGLLLIAIALGAVAATRRNRAGAATFDASLMAVDRQLAAATAEDHGWERATLDAAARDAFAEQQPRRQASDARAGADRRRAGHRLRPRDLPHRRHRRRVTRLTLGRRNGAWYAKAVEDDRE